MEVRTVSRVVVEYTTREGVPTRAEVSIPEQDGIVALDADQDKGEIAVALTAIVPARGSVKFTEIDDEPNPYATNGHMPKENAQLGLVGKIIGGAVSLAILVPFIGILWAWAMGVIEGMG